MKLGADIHKRTKNEHTCLSLAVISRRKLVIELLLKKGVKINESVCTDGNYTSMTLACKLGNTDYLDVLFKYGACYQPPTTHILSTNLKNNFLRHIAILKFENTEFDKNNLEYIREHKFWSLQYKVNLHELRFMKKCEIYDGFTYYDIIKLRENYEQLTSMFSSKKFDKALMSSGSLRKFRGYGNFIERIYKRHVIN